MEDKGKAGRIEELLQQTRRAKRAAQSADLKAAAAVFKLKVFKVALWLLKLSDNAEVAAQYVAMRRRRNAHWEAPSASDLRERLAELPAKALSLEGSAAAENQELKQQAEEYLAHVGLAGWIERQNVERNGPLGPHGSQGTRPTLRQHGAWLHAADAGWSEAVGATLVAALWDRAWPVQSRQQNLDRGGAGKGRKNWSTLCPRT